MPNEIRRSPPVTGSNLRISGTRVWAPSVTKSLRSSSSERDTLRARPDHVAFTAIQAKRRAASCRLGVGAAFRCRRLRPGRPAENPTWADAQPILRAECSGCHGATANQTGSGYRFDFYDMTDDPCGEAAAVLTDAVLAHEQANNIALAITTTDPDVRPSMPPLPAPYLTDNEWMTILRWTANPIKGDKPASNRPPHITVEGTPNHADRSLDVNVVITDPEGDPVVGLVKVGEQVAKLDHAGAFSAQFDTSSWPAGAVNMSAVLCDGLRQQTTVTPWERVPKLNHSLRAIG